MDQNPVLSLITARRIDAPAAAKSVERRSMHNFEYFD